MGDPYGSPHTLFIEMGDPYGSPHTLFIEMGGPYGSPHTPPFALGADTRVQSHRQHDHGAEDEPADESMDDRQRQHRRLPTGDPHRREPRQIRANPERDLQAEQRQQ